MRIVTIASPHLGDVLVKLIFTPAELLYIIIQLLYPLASKSTEFGLTRVFSALGVVFVVIERWPRGLHGVAIAEIC